MIENQKKAGKRITDMRPAFKLILNIIDSTTKLTVVQNDFIFVF